MIYIIFGIVLVTSIVLTAIFFYGLGGRDAYRDILKNMCKGEGLNER